jgi:hypothetical protein
MKGRRCHESGIGNGVDFAESGFVEVEDDLGSWGPFSIVDSGRGG